MERIGKEILDYIKQYKLILPGETIGVAVSGGVDSMSLLHFLHNHKDVLDCNVVAITVDHMLRGENSLGDALFVKNWCKENGIYCHKYSVDAGKIATERRIGVEQAAREVRYNVFDNLIKENIIDKIALAHHISDQAETVLMHLLRGAGLNGAGGMEPMRDNVYIRPFLNATKDDIVRYASINYIEYVEDETNNQTKYNRNFLRNVIMPQLKQRWEGVEQNLINFAASCREDNEFILSYAQCGGTIKENNFVKVPIVYFHYHPSVINRILFESLDSLNSAKNIERKHIDMVKELALNENGKKVNLPNGIVVQKEYDYITLFRNERQLVAQVYPFKSGIFNFADLAEIKVRRTKDLKLKEDALLIDADKLPKNAVWRTRKNGDKFTKFGGGTKPLRSFFIDKKIPNRLRDLIPVLAVDDEVYCVAGIEISNKVRVTDSTKSVYVISKKEIQKNKL